MQSTKKRKTNDQTEFKALFRSRNKQSITTVDNL